MPVLVPRSVVRCLGRAELLDSQELVRGVRWLAPTADYVARPCSPHVRQPLTRFGGYLPFSPQAATQQLPAASFLPPRGHAAWQRFRLRKDYQEFGVLSACRPVAVSTIPLPGGAAKQPCKLRRAKSPAYLTRLLSSEVFAISEFIDHRKFCAA